MKHRLAENIKSFRKEKNMTQEQLAEALGVSIGAVYKWEKDMSIPSINLILEMADLFEASTDVLLGYEWKNGSMGIALDSIIRLSDEKQYDKAAIEVEKALKKYPNAFNIVYQSAMMYMSMGEALREHKYYTRAIELYEHSCELIAQNTDEDINEIQIKIKIAGLYVKLGNAKRSLELLKKYNVCGINNATIGMILGDIFHNADESEKYLKKAFMENVQNIDNIMIGYINVFYQRKNYDAALDCLQWLRNMLRGIQPENKLTYFDKYDCVLLETISEVYCFKNDLVNAKQYLKKALEKAIRYDLTDSENIQGIELYSMMKIENQPTYEAYGKSAMDSLQRRIQPDDDGIPHMWELWIEVKKEVLPNEAI